VTRALIAGAGIGGLAAATALARAGLEVQVFERAREIREVGAGISLWANAIRALDHLGVHLPLESHGIPDVVGGLRTADGAVISAMSPAELRRLLGVPVIVLHRADLLAALLAAVPPSSITFGAACTSALVDGGGVEILCAAGGSARGDLLIGADGLYSVVRAALHGSAPPRYAGCTAWRAVVPFDRARMLAGETWDRETCSGRCRSTAAASIGTRPATHPRASDRRTRRRSCGRCSAPGIRRSAI
jgi:2-polyprenyl-6-methoxyphenol hydroxylase-like FAD-dependent oxidoreductase